MSAQEILVPNYTIDEKKEPEALTEGEIKEYINNIKYEDMEKAWSTYWFDRLEVFNVDKKKHSIDINLFKEKWQVIPSKFITINISEHMLGDKKHPIISPETVKMLIWFPLETLRLEEEIRNQEKVRPAN